VEVLVVGFFIDVPHVDWLDVETYQTECGVKIILQEIVEECVGTVGAG